MAKTVKIDLDPIVRYFKSLSQGMAIAWAALFLGIILVIVSFFV